MAAATHVLPPAPPVQRPRVLMVGTAFATGATLMVFAGLIGMYLSRRAELIGAGDSWLPKGVEIPLQQPNIMLFTLIASAVTVQWAVYAISRNDRINTYLALGRHVRVRHRLHQHAVVPVHVDEVRCDCQSASGVRATPSRERTSSWW